jgi:hypothetical protein
VTVRKRLDESVHIFREETELKVQKITIYHRKAAAGKLSA